MNTYVEGWRLGLKAIAIYRDGSKRSAPLNTRKTKDMGAAVADGADAGLTDRRRTAKAHPRTRRRSRARCAASSINRCGIACPTRACRSRTSSRSPVTKVTSRSASTKTASRASFSFTMSKEGSTIGGLMDTVGTLTSMALQYGVPLESLVKKFAYQRFEPSGFTKNPDIRNATSITDYVFRWLGCQFIKGYKEATSPNRGQPELPMKEIAEMEKKAVNRPVSDLPRTGEKELIDVITNHAPNEG